MCMHILYNLNEILAIRGVHRPKPSDWPTHNLLLVAFSYSMVLVELHSSMKHMVSVMYLSSLLTIKKRSREHAREKNR